jgi:hypothetical protein
MLHSRVKQDGTNTSPREHSHGALFVCHVMDLSKGREVMAAAGHGLGQVHVDLLKVLLVIKCING